MQKSSRCDGLFIPDFELDGALAPTNVQLGFEGWALAADEPLVGGTRGVGFDVVVQSDVGEDKLELLGGEEAAWAGRG